MSAPGKWSSEPICDACFARENPDRRPHRLIDPEQEPCISCGAPTAGIYVRHFTPAAGSPPGYGTLTEHGDHLGPCMACWAAGDAAWVEWNDDDGGTHTVTGRPDLVAKFLKAHGPTPGGGE